MTATIMNIINISLLIKLDFSNGFYYDNLMGFLFVFFFDLYSNGYIRVAIYNAN
jgi:hypothetical protein